MIHIFMQIVDFFFPPSPSLVCIRQHPQSHLYDYYHLTPVGDVLTLATYQTPLIKACVTAGKFEKNLRALMYLGTLLERYLKEAAVEHTLFVPIPLHHARERDRGYNQVTEIIRSTIKKQPNAGAISTLLSRTKATPAQSHLNRSDRLKNLTDAFSYHQRRMDWSRIATVYLVDDVLTTGATLEAARKVLAPHLPPHVTLICIAITH
jgi:ComF family protein